MTTKENANDLPFHYTPNGDGRARCGASLISDVSSGGGIHIEDTTCTKCLYLASFPAPSLVAEKVSGEGELLPCPFCGGEVGLSLNWRNGKPVEYIVCETVDCFVSMESLSGLEKSWNRRVSVPVESPAPPSRGPHDWTHPADMCDEPGCDHITRRTCEGAEKLTKWLRETLKKRTDRLAKADPAWAEQAAKNLFRSLFGDETEDELFPPLPVESPAPQPSEPATSPEPEPIACPKCGAVENDFGKPFPSPPSESFCGLAPVAGCNPNGCWCHHTKPADKPVSEPSPEPSVPVREWKVGDEAIADPLYESMAMGLERGARVRLVDRLSRSRWLVRRVIAMESPGWDLYESELRPLPESEPERGTIGHVRALIASRPSESVPVAPEPTRESQDETCSRCGDTGRVEVDNVLGNAKDGYHRDSQPWTEACPCQQPVAPSPAPTREPTCDEPPSREDYALLAELSRGAPSVQGGLTGERTAERAANLSLEVGSNEIDILSRLDRLVCAIERWEVENEGREHPERREAYRLLWAVRRSALRVLPHAPEYLRAYASLSATVDKLERQLTQTLAAIQIVAESGEKDLSHTPDSRAFDAVVELRRKSERLNAAVRQHKETLERVTYERDEHQRHCEERRQHIAELQESIRQHEETIGRLTRRNDEFFDRLSATGAERDAAAQKVADRDRTIAEQAAGIEGQRELIRSMQADKERLFAEWATQDRTARDLRSKLTAAEETIRWIKETAEMSTDSRLRDAILPRLRKSIEGGQS